MKTIAILGATGSIGTQTLEVVRNNGDIKVLAMSAGRNIELFEKQIREFKPRLAAVWHEKEAQELKVRIADMDVEVLGGMEGQIAVAVMQGVDMLVAAMVGMIGLKPTIAAIKAGKDIALANKETLVVAGHIIMPLAEKYNSVILPVDSEHSAIFQSLNGEDSRAINKILLTASGGPFRHKTRQELEHVTLADALKHPNWTMGKKITIDTATLVNKGLEMLEARWLFGVDIDDVEVVVQPKSIIHSMVEFVDGAIMAQMGTPDMRLPIQYALYYPERKFLAGERLDFKTLSEITFEQPDNETFLGIPTAIQAGKAGGSMPTVYNAANELSVAKFMRGEIKFLDIYEIIEGAMSRHKVVGSPSVDEILAIEQDTYDWIESRR